MERVGTSQVMSYGRRTIEYSNKKVIERKNQEKERSDINTRDFSAPALSAFDARIALKHRRKYNSSILSILARSSYHSMGLRGVESPRHGNRIENRFMGLLLRQDLRSYLN